MRPGRCCAGQLAQGQAIMANDSIPRPDGRFHARQNNFVTYVNGHLADVGLAPGVMGAEIRRCVAWASRPRNCDPSLTPTGPVD